MDEGKIPAFPAAWREVLPRSVTERAVKLAESAYCTHGAGSSPAADSSHGAGSSHGADNSHGADSSPAVFPPREQLFRALDLTPPGRVRAVILGQDPYPTAGHAHGLCFSVAPSVSPLPPSLRNIFKEYAACTSFPPPVSGDLTIWAERGVLLLNAVLTVEEGRPNAHRRLGWQTVTDAVLQACLRLDGPVAFLLWGREAQAAFDRAADSLSVKRVPWRAPAPFPAETAGPEKYVLRSSHPSPLGAGKPCGDSPPFLGSRPFSRANLLLGDRAVNWRLP